MKTNDFRPLLLKNIHRPDSISLAAYRESGGYKALARALKEMTPEQVLEEVKASGLRGRGGAGFPTGMKWGFLPKGPGEKYLVLNADESEPGTFKDRLLMERDPHLVLEGFLIGCYAVGCSHGCIYIRGEFVEAWRILLKAVEEAKAAHLAEHDEADVKHARCRRDDGRGDQIQPFRDRAIAMQGVTRPDPRPPPPHDAWIIP